MTFYRQVYEIVRRIPAGRVMSYGQIAWCAGNPRASRIVGDALRRNIDPSVPCHRVVRKDGGTVPAFGEGGQRRMLEAEGVEFGPEGRVLMEKYRWIPENLELYGRDNQ